MMASSIDESPHDGDILTPIIPSSKFTKLEELLKIWYRSISPRFVDLVSDFAGQEFFLLDGEARIQSIFNEPMLDLAGSKGGIHPIPLTTFLYSRQDFKCCTSSILWNVQSNPTTIFLFTCLFNGKVHHKALLSVDFANVSTLSESVETMLARTLAVIEHIGMKLSDKWSYTSFQSRLRRISKLYRKNSGLTSHLVRLTVALLYYDP